MITGLVRSCRRIPAAVTGAALAVHAGMWARVIPCPGMSMTACLATAAVVTITASLAAIVLRAYWLGRQAVRALASVPRTAMPAPAWAAARRAGVGEAVCLHGGRPTVFCAGLWRPRIYLTATAAAAFGTVGLDAVFAHETAHARRRDPLRRLLARAATDVLFYFPLTGWLSHRQAEKAELAADQAAISYVGRKAVAGALLAATAAPPAPAGKPATPAAGFDGAIDARIAQLSGETIPAPRPPLKPALASLLGLTLVLSLAMCLGQAALSI